MFINLSLIYECKLAKKFSLTGVHHLGDRILKRKSLKPYLETLEAQALGKYLLSLPKETLVSRIRLEHRAYYEEHDARKHKVLLATKKRWEADAKAKREKE